MQQESCYKGQCYILKALNYLVPSYASDISMLKSSVTKRFTRSSVRLLPYSGATLYNSLPFEIRQSTSLNSYKYNFPLFLAAEIHY